jgi:pentachlorophenol monooxygenase/3-(3-hydroxy-phenyl)propionate hydroxylase
LVRTGITVLIGDAVEPRTAQQATTGFAVPVNVHAVSELATDLAGVLDARPVEVWVIRPDGHIAAVLPDPDASSIRCAINRALASTAPIPV